MEARATLIPGATYHLHISICNTGDNAYDSGLFLEGASTFCSSVANVSVNNITGHTATAVWQKPSDEDSLYYVMVDGVLDSIISNDSTLVYQMNNLQDDTTHSFGVGIPCISASLSHLPSSSTSM